MFVKIETGEGINTITHYLNTDHIVALREKPHGGTEIKTDDGSTFFTLRDIHVLMRDIKELETLQNPLDKSI